MAGEAASTVFDRLGTPRRERKSRWKALKEMARSLALAAEEDAEAGGDRIAILPH
jgi:hypothetical protein